MNAVRIERIDLTTTKTAADFVAGLTDFQRAALRNILQFGADVDCTGLPCFNGLELFGVHFVLSQGEYTHHELSCALESYCSVQQQEGYVRE